MFKAHPDYGGTNTGAREVLEAYAILKREFTRCSKGPSCSISSSALATAKSSAASTRAGRARVFFLALFAPGVGAALPTHDALDHHGRDAREHGLGHRG
jgi:hypothetical protein